MAGVEGGRWPPVLNSVEECPHYSLIGFFFQTFPFELDPLKYPFADVLPPAMCSKFLKQVRNSWGYDVNVKVPHSHLLPVSRACLLEEEGTFQKHDIGECVDLVHQINNLAEEHGKSYEFDQLKRAVFMPGPRYILLTFTVREVSSGQLERVRVCCYLRTIVQWFFEDKGEYEDEDYDEDSFVAGTSPRDWLQDHS